MSPFIVEHPLTGLIPFGKDFTAEVPALVDRLRARCGMTSAQADFSRATVMLIDAYWLPLGGDAVLGEPEFFCELVAYVGEVIRREWRGQWELRESDEFPGTWEPYVIEVRLEAPIGLVMADFLRDPDPQHSMLNAVAFMTGKEHAP
jgi:hypothetical protein